MGQYKVQRFLFRSGAKRTLHGIRTAVWALEFGEDKDLVFEKVELALGLVAKYAPEKFRALRRDIGSILVAGNPSFLGCYHHQLRMAELYADHVLDPQTTPQSVACTLIHEAQHARLRRLGFGYEEAIRDRIERLCFRAERNFARKMPGCDALIARADAWLESDLAPVFSNEGRWKCRAEALRKLGCPDWLIKVVAWRLRPRAR